MVCSDVSADRQLLVVGDDTGSVRLYHYPAPHVGSESLAVPGETCFFRDFARPQSVVVVVAAAAAVIVCAFAHARSRRW